jgi:hypothetical protein
VLETDVGVGQILGVLGGLVGEIVVPDKSFEVLPSAGVVVDPESGGCLVGRGVRHGDGMAWKVLGGWQSTAGESVCCGKVSTALLSL